MKRARENLNRILNSPERRERANAVDKQRRTPHGYFHIAESYFFSARQLRGFKQQGHSDHPIRLAYYTAIELYLKSFLRRHAISTADLSKRSIGHRYCCLVEKASSLELHFMDEDLAVLCWLSYSDERERVRYHETGSAHWIDIGALDRTCVSLRESVYKSLREVSLPVRLRELEEWREGNE
jgi:hypothetical protein